ncbi:substrate-binding periplasmic protein [Desulfopila aestuarii]|uniref:Polar amino acid transport system substrate-binding protein n=1 Tax=Desulfopila aestuarii DSM 18488 TaxID=1121416 RepID=A0A1M7Y4T0_9BACT|nr:transporter substrate-binding domain-containing protein [Desulfopila aestuarii]SHO47345.1 polar amino acid transport system substrate-binding protein [Desulfopila aestuarii DSM 18488]
MSLPFLRLVSRERRIRLIVFFITLLTLVTTNNLYAEKLVLVAADSIPTAYIDNGKLTGILVDVITEAFRRAGYPIEIQLMPWARALSEVSNGNVDGIFSVFKLPERESFLTYTESPIITQVESFFARKDSSITFEGDLNKFKHIPIGIIRKTSYGEKIDAAIHDGIWENITATNSVESVVKMLVNGRVDLAPSYRHVFIRGAKEIGVLDEIKELSPSVESIPSYLAFTKKHDYSEIIRAYHKALAAMKQDGTFDNIYNKYLQ